MTYINLNLKFVVLLLMLEKYQKNFCITLLVVIEYYKIFNIAKTYFNNIYTLYYFLCNLIRKRGRQKEKNL